MGALPGDFFLVPTRFESKSSSYYITILTQGRHSGSFFPDNKWFILFINCLLLSRFEKLSSTQDFVSPFTFMLTWRRNTFDFDIMDVFCRCLISRNSSSQNSIYLPSTESFSVSPSSVDAGPQHCPVIKMGWLDKNPPQGYETSKQYVDMVAIGSHR